jgi:hypothetical protein
MLTDVAVEIPTVVLLMRLSGEQPTPLESWVVIGGRELMRQLQQVPTITSDQHRWSVIAVQWEDDRLEPAASEAAEAVFELTRGIAQSLTLETKHLRCNVIRGSDIVADDIVALVSYLSSSSGGFAAGATFDLRGA